MAIAFDSMTESTESSNPAITLSHTCNGSNRILFVIGWVRGNGNTVSSMTYNGVSMTQIGSQLDTGTGNHDKSFMFYLVNPASGTHDVSISFSGNNYCYAIACSYTGAKQTGQPDNSADRTTKSETNSTVSLTTVADNSWVIMGWAGTGSSATAGTGTTKRNTVASNSDFFDSNGPITPAGSTSLVVIHSLDNCVANIASISPAISSGPVNISSFNGVLESNVSFINGLSIASVKSFNNLT